MTQVTPMNALVKQPLAATSGLRDAMRRVAGAVSVVTVGIGDDRTGLTVTSAVSLSIDPPTMIICINRESSAWPALQKYRHFCVNFLTDSQQEIADRFAGRLGARGSARYDHAAWAPLVTGALALEGALVSIDCEIEEFIDRHSHSVIVGVVRALQTGQGAPLIYTQGGYHTLSPSR